MIRKSELTQEVTVQILSCFLILIVGVVKALWTGSSPLSTPACHHGNERPASANPSPHCCGPVRGPSTLPDVLHGIMNTVPSPKTLLLLVSVLKQSGWKINPSYIYDLYVSPLYAYNWFSLLWVPKVFFTHRALWRQCLGKNNSRPQDYRGFGCSLGCSTVHGFLLQGEICLIVHWEELMQFHVLHEEATVALFIFCHVHL